MKTINPVVWFEIYVDDIGRAMQFYEAVLQVKLSELNSEDSALTMYTFPMSPDAPNASGALVKIEGLKAGGGATLVYFACDDCAVEESRVEKSGGKVFRPKMSIGKYGFVSLCIDTEGNMFGLHSGK